MKKLVILSVLSLFFFTSCITRVVTTTPATKVVAVKYVPKHHRVVYVKGNKYYYWNGKYHRRTHRGYVVVKI